MEGQAKTESRAFRLLAALLGIVIPALWFLTVVTPGEEAVKIRNSLVVRMGDAADFTWTPGEAPSSYLVNRAPVPESYRRIAAGLAPASATSDSDLSRAFAIAADLMRAPKRFDTPIQSDLMTAYRGITAQGKGYCADFTQVFTGMALASGLAVRTWSISFEGFGSGHAFNEVYDRTLGKWVLVDSFHSLYFVDPESRTPLSVLELHDRLLSIHGQRRPVAVLPIVPGRFAFRSEPVALDYYRRGMPQLALAWGDNVFDYDRSRLVRWSAKVSRYAERLMAIASGVYPQLRVYPVGVSHRDLDALFRVRNRFLLALAALGVATVVFGWQIVELLASPRSVRGPDPLRNGEGARS